MVDDSSSSSRTDVETKLYKESVKCLERRWTELSKPEHLITMIICSNSFSKTSNEKVEDRVSDLAGGFLPPDVLNIIIAYAKARRRP
ncbi:Transforming growth factor beta regulator 4 [Caligus rogercresseyi]|uniref:Transforming growth factor beta regulator 4 n=1 Tax=Caligus rogercresseyi TaxID=217165 RepID=A0A7T8QRR8_CALRO|nr:Transforming growth factor beta regulator 4 [Caligus rogercresseyi]